MKDKKELIEDDIIEMLDTFMAAGGGHMNVEVGSLHNEMEKQIEKNRSYECSKKTMACQSPTLHEGLDAQE